MMGEVGGGAATARRVVHSSNDASLRGSSVNDVQLVEIHQDARCFRLNFADVYEGTQARRSQVPNIVQTPAQPLLSVRSYKTI